MGLEGFWSAWETSISLWVDKPGIPTPIDYIMYRKRYLIKFPDLIASPIDYASATNQFVSAWVDQRNEHESRKDNETE